jgi:protein associated with RNAse G/E
MLPSDKERMTALEVYQNQNMQEHKEIKEALKENSAKLDQLIDKLEKKFSAKWVEIAMK